MSRNSVSRSLRLGAEALGGMSEIETQNLRLADACLMLGALPDAAALGRVREWLAARLRKQLSTTWVVSGDLRDVFSVLTALWQYDSTLVTGEQLAAAIQRLIQSEVNVGGPYRSADNTVAIAANVQIALFMRLAAKPLPKVADFLAQSIRSGQFAKTMLADKTLTYLLAKAGDYPDLVVLATHDWQQTGRTPLQTAICLAILKGNLQPADTALALAKLCRAQQQNGFWNDGQPRGATPHQTHFATTALIVNVLASHQQQAKTGLAHKQNDHRNVALAAAELFNGRAEPLRTSALTAVKQICKTDKKFEITLLPRYFGQALKTSPTLTGQQYAALGAASVCGWIAYTIYDDFLDGEGEPAQLPTANVAMRASLHCFWHVLPVESAMRKRVAEVFDATDEANAWEIAHCRFAVQGKQVVISELPAYGNRTVLAARSFACALAPMVILAHASPRAQQTRLVESAFRHYLIGRQLNDDMRDWQADMRAGHASYVVTAILRDMRVKPGSCEMPTLLPAMQRRFRQTTMPKIAQRISWHIAASRRAFAKSQLLQPANDIYALLDVINRSAQRSLDEQAKSQALAAIASRQVA